MSALLRRLRRTLQLPLALMAVLLIGLLGFVAPSPALASGGDYLTSSSYKELTAALNTTTDKQRLEDLQVLEQAVASSTDRAQISNGSSHNLGVFARYKKDLPTQAASFYVLGPGHQTDDDYEIVGLYVPSDVRLVWGASNGTSATAAARVARVLEGEQLTVGDLVDDREPESVAYQLSLPAFAVETQLASVDPLPSFSQAQLDLELETAPLD